MQIQINTDRSIEGHEALAAHVSGVVEEALSQISAHVTRVEVYLADEDSVHHRGGLNDMRCVMEARIEGYHPLAVTAHADSLHKSVVSAADKLARVIESTLDRLHDHKHRRDALRLCEETPDETLGTPADRRTGKPSEPPDRNRVRPATISVPSLSAAAQQRAGTIKP